MTPQRYVHPLVQALVKNLAEPPDLTLINGYIGPSGDDANVRLYRNLRMNVWLDIPRDKIVHTDHVPPGSTSPWGEDVIWMHRRDARRLSVGTSAPKDIAATSEREPARTGRRPAAEPGPVVRIDVFGAEAAAARPQPPDDDIDLGGGGNIGYSQQWPPK
jgi:hypothetical protein